MKRHKQYLTSIFSFCLFLIAPLGYAAKDESRARQADRQWFALKYWEEQAAEVNIYKSRELLKRASRLGKVVILFERQEGQKSSGLLKGKRRLVDTQFMQMRMVRDTRLGILWQRLRTAVTISGPSGTVLELTLSSQDWGETLLKHVKFGLKSRTPVARFSRSSRDFPSLQSFTYSLTEMRDAVPYEALPLFLRSLDFDKGAVSILLIEPLDSLTMEEPRAGAGRVTIYPTKKVDMEAKQYEVRPITVSHFLGEDSFWFTEKQPKVLVRWLRYNGSEYKLVHSDKLDYWNKMRARDVGMFEHLDW